MIDRVVAVRPAEVIAGLDADELLGGVLGALLRIVELRPVLKQLVAAMLRCPESPVGTDGESHRVADAGRDTLAGGLRLTCLRGIELPDAGARLELGARIVARRLVAPIPHLAGVGERADVHEQTARPV